MNKFYDKFNNPGKNLRFKRDKMRLNAQRVLN